MTEISNPEFEAKVERAGNGEFTAWKGSAPEIEPLAHVNQSSSKMVRDLTADLNTGPLFTNDSGQPLPHEVLPAADEVEVTMNPDGTYTATARFGDINFVEWGYDASGIRDARPDLQLDEQGYSPRWTETVKWLEANKPVIDSYLAINKVSDDPNFDWHDSTLTVTVPVTADEAGHVTWKQVAGALTSDQHVKQFHDGLINDQQSFLAGLETAIRLGGTRHDGTLTFDRFTDDFEPIIEDDDEDGLSFRSLDEVRQLVLAEIGPNMTESEVDSRIWTVKGSGAGFPDVIPEIIPGVHPDVEEGVRYIGTAAPWTSDTPITVWDN